MHYVRAAVEIELEKVASHSDNEFTLMKRRPPQSGETSPITESGINEYEMIIQKLENDVRNHIRNEQTLKLHIETMQNGYEEADRAREAVRLKQNEQIDRLRKERRRMDELVTLKEEQLEKLQVKVRDLEYQSSRLA